MGAKSGNRKVVAEGLKMKISTAITEMLGIDLPILGAPMFLVSNVELVVAVGEAGGLGCFPAQNYRTLRELEEAIGEIRNRSSRPFGVNIVLYKEHNPQWKEQLDICLRHRVRLLIASMGTPRGFIREAKEVGTLVFADVVNLRMARVAARAGVDALIAVSQGAGGHAGTINPFSLIPYLKKETALPVVAAGCISTGEHLAAALSLGADAVYVGTRLIATPESGAVEAYKKMIIDSAPEEIIYSDEVSGHPANWLSPSLEQFRTQREKKSSADEFKRWRDIWSAGQGVAQIEDRLPVAAIIQRMATDYERIRRELPSAGE